MTGRFTGWHMFVALIAMFGTVLAANLVMARFAIATFGGTVVDNSYVATRNYDRWLAEAEAQKLLGWQIAASLQSQRRLRITVGGPDGPIDGVVSVIASHPLGRAPDRIIQFVPVGAGQYGATRSLPPGRWKLKITVTSGETVARFNEGIRS